jgi:hypothetical protein
VGGFAVPDSYGGLNIVAAVVFGMGAALVLDEFALILHLRDVYWTEEGRASVDAVFIAGALTGMLLLGARPVGWSDADVLEVRGTQLLIATIVYVLWMMINLGSAVVALLKGKIWTGLIGIFIPVLLYVGAIRLARPGSPWARWRYRPGSRKCRRAERHEQRVRRPLIKGKIWVQEFIAGRHDLIPLDRLQRQRHRDDDQERTGSGTRL